METLKTPVSAECRALVQEDTLNRSILNSFKSDMTDEMLINAPLGKALLGRGELMVPTSTSERTTLVQKQTKRACSGSLRGRIGEELSLIHISEPTRPEPI
eukprot:2874768-Pyramimonas_sp.AAC.1